MWDFLWRLWFRLSNPSGGHAKPSTTPDDQRPRDIEGLKQLAADLNMRGAKLFIGYAQHKGISDGLLNQYIDDLENKNITQALFEDTTWLIAKGASEEEITQAIKIEYMYLFLTWPDYPFKRQPDLLDVFEKDLAEHSVSAYKLYESNQQPKPTL